VSPPRATARDFFSELVRGSQAGRAGFVAERERWLRSLKVQAREELLFELEMLLRGLERTFNLHNLPVDQPVVARDFKPELEDVRDAIFQVIHLSRQLLDPESDQRMVFRRYVESVLANDDARRRMLEEELDQQSPQESLFVLRQSFDAIKTLIEHLLKLKSLPYPVFTGLGNLVLREILLNRYFRPFRPLELRVEYDRLKSVPLLDALALRPRAERAVLTTAVVAYFRGLHYLSCMSNDPSKPVERRARVVLALVRGEAQTLAAYLAGPVRDTVTSKKLKTFAEQSSENLLQQSERIPRVTLAGTHGTRGTPERAAAHALTAVFQEHLVVLARTLEIPLPEERGAFGALVSGVDRAVRLRHDLWGLQVLAQETAVALRGRSRDGSHSALLTLRRYLAYFHDTSFQLMRNSDSAAIEPYAALVFEHEPSGPSQRERLADDTDKFIVTLKGKLAGVQRRSDLANVPFEVGDVRQWVDRFRVT
jgi:hypothetical protein